MKKIIAKFTEHPASVGETYFGHMKFTLIISGYLIKTAGGIVLHGLMPFCFTTYGSDRIKTLAQHLSNRNYKRES